MCYVSKSYIVEACLTGDCPNDLYFAHFMICPLTQNQLTMPIPPMYSVLKELIMFVLVIMLCAFVEKVNLNCPL